MTWDVIEDDRFNVTIGKLLVRADGPGRATCRMFPDRRHSNLGNMVHGGAILTFVDMAFFAGGRLAGADVMRAVTLDCDVRFLAPGRLGVPLDAEVELLRETSRLAMFRGLVVQEKETVAAFSGTLRKATPPNPPRDGEGDRAAKLRGGGAAPVPPRDGEGDRAAKLRGGGAAPVPPRNGEGDHATKPRGGGAAPIPPRNGEGDRAAKLRGGGAPLTSERNRESTGEAAPNRKRIRKGTARPAAEGPADPDEP
jgi:uncharacterized protein (TIGR00369 family)